MLRRNRISLEEHDDAGIVHPCAQDCVDRELSAAKILVQIFLFDRMRPFVRNLPGLVAHVEFGDVALFRQFDPLFVGKLPETPEDTASAGRTSRMKSVAAALRFAVPDGQVNLSPKRLDTLL